MGDARERGQREGRHAPALRRAPAARRRELPVDSRKSPVARSDHPFPVNSVPTPAQPESRTGVDEAAQRWFLHEIHPHEGQLKAYLRKAYPAVPDPADIVQESFLRVWKARAAAPVRSAKSFLFQIARRLAIDVIRRRRVAGDLAVCEIDVRSVLDDGPDAADAACRNEELWLLAQAIAALPARCREVMILRKIEGLSQKEIAERLGITEGTVQVHIGRGLRHLERHLEGIARR